MLWNVVFEFFVKYIFGGIIDDGTSYVQYRGNIGSVFNVNGSLANVYTSGFLVKGFSTNGFDFNMPLGNYLSFIATIITMVVILVLCCALIKKIYNICAHVIG